MSLNTSGVDIPDDLNVAQPAVLGRDRSASSPNLDNGTGLLPNRRLVFFAVSCGDLGTRISAKS